MKNIKIILLLILPYFTLAQSTIYEALKVEKIDCKVDTYIEPIETSKESGYVEMEIEYLPEPETRGVDSLEQHFIKNFKNTSDYYSPDTETDYTYPLKSGDFCFQEKGKWGVKKASGKIILTPKFDFVKTDTMQFGFVGYKKDKCNYYVGKKYKKALKDDYYFIKAMKNGSFVVQTKEGYGILNAKNKWILSPNNQWLKGMRSNEEVVYDFFDAEGNRFIFLEKYKKRFYPKGYGYTSGFNLPTFQDDYLIFSSVVFNIKTGEQFFCHPEYNTDIVSEESQIAFVRNENSDAEGYLSDFEGRLITSQAFQSVNTFNAFKQSIASIKNTDKGKELFGVIDEQGNWIIPPNYKKIKFQYDHYMVSSPEAKSYGFQGVYDTKGKVKVLPDGSVIEVIKEDIFARQKIIDGQYFCDVIQLSENKLLKKDLPFSIVNYIKLCDAFVVKGYNQSTREYTIMDESFQPITSDMKGFSYGDGRIVARYQNENGKTTRKIFRCGIEIKSVKLKEDLIKEYQEYFELSEDLSFIKLIDGTNYFIYQGKTIPLRGEIWESKGDIRSMYLAEFQDFVMVQKNEKYFMVNYSGEIILPNIFTHLGRFDKKTGLARYGRGSNKNGFITQSGEFLFGGKYDKVEYLGLNLFKVISGKLQGVVNITGKVIVPLQEHFVWLDGGVITISKNMKTLKTFSIEGK